METIVSGTTRGRLMRTVMLALMFSVYTGWSLYDAYAGYPRANVEAVLRTKLGLADIDPSVTTDARVSRRSCETVVRGTDREDVFRQLGAPALEHDGRLYFFGTGGFVTIDMRGDVVRSVEWTDGPTYPPASIGFQKLIGFSLLPVALAMLVKLSRVLRTRVVLTEDALMIGRGPAIPLDSITHVRRAGSESFDLAFECQGRSRVVRLDGYVIAKAAQMVGAICAHNHLPEPTEKTTNP